MPPPAAAAQRPGSSEDGRVCVVSLPLLPGGVSRRVGCLSNEFLQTQQRFWLGKGIKAARRSCIILHGVCLGLGEQFKPVGDTFR